MPEPWKSILCDSPECLNEMFLSDPEEPRCTRLNDATIREHKIYPEIDTEGLVLFRCPRCGKVETWGPLRQQAARILYEKFYPPEEEEDGPAK